MVYIFKIIYNIMKYIKEFEQIGVNIPKEFRYNFFKLYPKGTKIFFVDTKNITYELELLDINNNSLIFKAENDCKIIIRNPYYISDKDLLKISIFSVKITPESKELVDSMFEEFTLITVC